MEYLEKEKEDDGGSNSELDNDALVRVLGKDHSGYVKGVSRFGVGVGHRKAFGKVSQKSNYRDKEIETLKATNNSRDKEIESLKATIARLESKFEAFISGASSYGMLNAKEVVSSPLRPQPKPPLKVIIVLKYMLLLLITYYVMLTVSWFAVVGPL